MADEYMDIISFRQRGDKPYAHKIGSAKANGKGGINCYFDSIPLPDKDGRVSVLISPRQEKSDRTATRPARPAAPSSSFPDDDPSDLPF